MWIQTQFCVGGSKRFFYLSFGNDGLKEYYNLNFALLYYHKFDISLFDDMIPWEKDVYVTLLVNKIKEEEEKRKQQELENRSRSRKR
jgi:hypothetical protein